MDKDDIIHYRIIAFIEKYHINGEYLDENYSCYRHYRYFFMEKEIKPTKIKGKIDASRYNSCIYYFIIEILSYLNIIDYYFHDEYAIENKIKEGSQLIIDILNNNYTNIRYNFTVEVIKQYHWNQKLIKSIKKYNLFPHLERIHPEKIGFCNKIYEKSAYIIYNEIRELQIMAWISAIIKAGAFL